MATNRRDDVLISIDGVSKHFDTTPGVMDRLLRRDPQPVRAVDNVSLTIEQGETMGVAGESGCGKTTLGKLLVRLYDPTEGTISFDGTDIATLANQDESEFRQRVQMIFQDPFESLNPRMTVYQSVVEPLKINGIGSGYRERRDRVIEVLNDVGLSPAEAYLEMFPRELSGGERQRVAIARALVVDPDFVVADEPVSMLDVSIRAGVLNLMKRLQDEYGLTYLFISHDLSLIRYMCDRTAIMYLGEVVEQGPTVDIVEDPKHPYTEALFDAVPEVEGYEERQRANVSGEVPSPRNPPEGCRFHPRCPHIIPPDDWGGDQDAFRRSFQFKRRLELGELTADSLDVDPTLADRDAMVRALLEHGLRLEVPEAHRAPGETGAAVDLAAVDLPPDAERALRDAAGHVIDDEEERAVERLDGEFPTVCVDEYPTLRTADTRLVACHLFPAEEDREAPVAEHGD